MGHLDGGRSHKKDKEADEGEDVGGTLRTGELGFGEGEGREPHVLAVLVDVGTFIYAKGIGAASSQKSFIGGIAHKNGSKDKHTGSDREGDQIAGGFLEPFGEGFAPGHGVHENLDGGSNRLDNDHDIGFDEREHEFEHGNDKGYCHNEVHGRNHTDDGAGEAEGTGAKAPKYTTNGAANRRNDTISAFKNDRPSRVGHETRDHFGGVDDADGGNKINHKIDEKVHKVDHKADDGVAEGDEDEGNEEIGEGGLDGNNRLGVHFGAEHDHDPNHDKHDDVEGVGKVTEDLPELEKWLHGVVASALGIGAADGGDTNIVHDISDIFLTRYLIVVEQGDKFLLDAKNARTIDISRLIFGETTTDIFI